jgi:hypothetical protein
MELIIHLYKFRRIATEQHPKTELPPNGNFARTIYRQA